jgi:hypothetical protein
MVGSNQERRGLMEYTQSLGIWMAMKTSTARIRECEAAVGANPCQPEEEFVPFTLH